jgi:bifunctional ADP-heptose synthase (sugar kinase/adenylyltransferase)
VLVATEELTAHAGRVTMVDGGFDPLHAGHVAYFRAAAELGLPVLCNVSSDDWVGRKHAPLLPQEERGAVIDALRDIAYTHLSHAPTVDVLRALRPRFYAKGADWRGRLPDAETAACAELGVDVVYLETVLDSSTEILQRYRARSDERD